MNDPAFCPHCGSARRDGTITCANCGRSLEPVAESMEAAGAPASGWTPAANAGEMAVTSWRGLGIGAFIALVLPTSYLVLARLLEVGIVSRDQVRPLVPLLDAIQFPWGVVLGPVGIVVAGRSAGIRGGCAWLVLMVFTVPALAFFWLASVFAYSGATGRPF